MNQNISFSFEAIVELGEIEKVPMKIPTVVLICLAAVSVIASKY